MTKLESFFFQDGYSDGYMRDGSNYDKIMRTITLLPADCIAGDSYLKGVVAGWSDSNYKQEVKE